MFCPKCGFEDKQDNPFCRSCGAELGRVRTAVTTTDVPRMDDARHEIGRIVAAKIEQVQSARELKKVAEDILPKLEKFLETPEERRLRRMRAGTIVSAVGLGTLLSFMVASMLANDAGLLVIGALGGVALLIGLAIVVNAIFLTVPRGSKRREIEEIGTLPAANQTSELEMPPRPASFMSVTEGTTRHLSDINLEK